MADKKVGRSGRERPITPTQKMEAALSDPGTLNMAETAHDRGRAALVDKFRERGERWRREQSLQSHAQQAREGGEPTSAPEPLTTEQRQEGQGQEEGQHSDSRGEQSVKESGRKGGAL
ncbi:MAG: hypothetical protein M1274_12095 [Actinobacteria bacterium]|nr:hypothetical protein [Actinomycetota bacterium]